LRLGKPGLTCCPDSPDKIAAKAVIFKAKLHGASGRIRDLKSIGTGSSEPQRGSVLLSMVKAASFAKASEDETAGKSPVPPRRVPDDTGDQETHPVRTVRLDHA